MSTVRRLGCLAVSLACMLGASCAKHEAGEGEATDAKPTVEVGVRAVEERTFHASVEAPGQWRSTGEAIVAAPFAAYVESVGVNVGDAVARGQVLGTLVTRDSRAAVLGALQLAARARDAHDADEAKRALAQAQRDLVRVPLVASAAGTLVRRTMIPGGEAAEGTELLAIVPAGSLVFEAHVPAEAAAHVARGLHARITSEGGAAIEATVSRTLPQTSAADQTALVWLAPAGAVPAGLFDRFGTAHLELGAARRAAAVPPEALVEDDLSGEVRVARVAPGGVAIWSVVVPGDTTGGWRELRAPGLPAGTPVIVRGQRGLPDSTHVKIVP